MYIDVVFLWEGGDGTCKGRFWVAFQRGFAWLPRSKTRQHQQRNSRFNIQIILDANILSEGNELLWSSCSRR